MEGSGPGRGGASAAYSVRAVHARAKISSHGRPPWRRRGAGVAVLVALGAAACDGGARSAPSASSVQVAPLQIVEGADRRASFEPVPTSSPIFDGQTVRLRAARGETVGVTVWQRPASPVTVELGGGGVVVRGFEVQWAAVRRPSTSMYGKSRGVGRYLDGLSASAAPSGSPVYLELEVEAGAAPGRRAGVLRAAGRQVAVELEVTAAVLPALGAAPLVWAYYDPRELAWRHGLAPGAPLGSYDPLPLERRCAAMFRAHGVLATPEVPPEQWPARRELLQGARFVPVPWPPESPGDAALAEAAAFWQQALDGDRLAFAIPIDEPRELARKRQVRALGDRLAAVRRATGATRLRLAVTDAPHPFYGDAVDIFISPRAVSRRSSSSRDASARWTYNGTPPSAGSMVLDASGPDLRTWGWIAWRWGVPLWYVWDALYWHDRHNARRRGLPRPGRAFEVDDAVTFDDGEDRGNLDGVLALPGPAQEPCRPTLRLKVLQRGLLDRLLLDAASCSAASRGRAQRLAERLVPAALGDADDRAWASSDELEWGRARDELEDLADACAREREAPAAGAPAGGAR